jgi:hypothetical protein
VKYDALRLNALARGYSEYGFQHWVLIGMIEIILFRLSLAGFSWLKGDLALAHLVLAMVEKVKFRLKGF